jgi:enediyne polyketide synthase
LKENCVKSNIHLGSDIYIVGMAAVFAGANNLKEFWETVLTRRLGFRQFPQRRMQINEYVSANRDDRDKTYVDRAALIDGFAFDWKANRVPKAAFEATDPVHWLALTTAVQAIEDGGVDLDAVGRARVGVILGNSLTGEVSRANLLRLRWPYVRRAIADGAGRAGFSDTDLAALLGEVEQSFKGPFPPPNEDTLAGALSNVIAGRICNVLDLGGGGYVVDGACASSLLAVSAACEALEAGRLDMALAGGVDVSLDPLEMVGFARTGALTSGAMRVYDKDSAGFLPGEGCGMVVLVRGADMERLGLQAWARIAGWGISSDGSGGITAPKTSGQAMAMRRCYARSGFDAGTLDFIEGHGTGTSVGDRQELLGFLQATAGGKPPSAPAPDRPALRRTGLTSVKTLLGHTKAAAGAAGLIKAALSVNQRVLAPMAGLRTPADAFATAGARIYPITQGGCLAAEAGLRAGVSGAGFGGINCHIAISGEGVPRRGMATREAGWLLASAQTAELFIASAGDVPALLARVDGLLLESAGMAEGELVDLAAACALRDQAGPLRAALVAGTVEELRGRLASLAQALRAAGDALPKAPAGIALGRANPALRIGYLIPGQGSQFLGMGRRLAMRAGWAAARRARWDAGFGGLGPAGLSGFIDRPAERADGPEVRAGWEAALRDTQVAQPAIVMTDLQWMEWLRRLGIVPSAVAGHSLGEVAALVAAGLLSEDECIEIVRVRAQACADEGVQPGGMLALKCGAGPAGEMAAASAALGYAVVANDNAPDQVVVAGDPQALAAIAGLARGRGIDAVEVNVSKAFHSRHMAAAAEALARLAGRRRGERESSVAFFSVVQGGLAPSRFDPFAYLSGQIMAPVRFREALEAIAKSCDFLLEAGPGSVLAGLARRTLGNALPVCALEPAGDGDAQFCDGIGRLFVAGASLDWAAFYAQRHWRPFVQASARTFIENPCARQTVASVPALLEASERPGRRAGAAADIPAGTSIEDVIRELVARETGYDLDMVSPEARLARDLNLDSIKVAEVRAELRARDIELPEDMALGLTPIRDIARAAVRILGRAGGRGLPLAVPPGLLPKDLPVLGYAHVWREARLVPSQPAVGRVMVLHGAGRAAEAGRLAGQLAQSGTRTQISDGAGPACMPDGQPWRLVALPGERADADGVAGFFARLGAWAVSGVAALVLATRKGQAPVYGFAQSLSLENPGLPVLAVESEDGDGLVQAALAQVDPGVSLLRRVADGSWQGRALERWEPSPAATIPLQAGEAVVISGGAKGITAECAFALLQATRARALLLGTSPEEAPGAEVEGTLRRIAASGLEAVYLRCDVTDPDSVREALRRGGERLGARRFAGLMHGAGVNSPAAAGRLDAAWLRREYAVKVLGLQNLLSAIGGDTLKLCVAFGSVIGSVGMSGNGGYALANESMACALDDFKRARPSVQVACPAYGVWAEVGMGSKLNVLESLERQNIGAISIEEGIRWFLECCGQADAPLPLVIAAPMHGLPTWRQARGTAAASGLPFVDDRVVHEPGVALVSRPCLNPQRDGWLADHSFRGVPLFATVQALVAMGSGARLLAGGGVVRRFADLEISRPIVATQQGDTTIEVDVRRAAPDAAAGPGWAGRIGMPGAAWADPAFAAHCTLGKPESGSPPFAVPAGTGEGWREVPAEVGGHLYDSILFQGRLFQRIEALLALDLSDGVRRKGRFLLRWERSEADAAVPDAFFLDAMLQSVQVLVPKDLCLPVGIAEIVYYAAAWEAGAALVEAEITERTETGYGTRVRAWNAADGRPVARYEGYRVNIVEHHAGRPDAHALLDPLACDQAALRRWLAGHSDIAGLDAALGSMDDSGQAARRAAAAAQIARQTGLPPSALTWSAEGAPSLRGRPGQGVAVAHDAGRLLTVCGDRRVGCDVQRVGGSSRPWAEILPAPRIHLWHALTGALNDRDRAGAIAWAIHEALFKAGAADVGVSFVGMEEGDPRFRLARDGVIAAGVLDFVLAGSSAIALAQLAGRLGEPRRVTHYSRAIEMTFKEALPPLKSPTASIFFSWMGELREEAMSDIRPALAHAFGVGGKGMLTNGTRVRILRPVPFHAPLRAWVWLERVLPGQPSTFELGFQWAETGPDGPPRRIVAQGLQRLTWVGLGPGGHATVEPFPEFFAEFIRERLPLPGACPFTPPLGRLPNPQADETALWRREAACRHEHGCARLWLETDETHSNFVGNVYFSHAAALVERACQKALRHLGRCLRGGFFATEFRLDHLGEAMPGDTLEAEARLAEAGPRFCRFDLALMNQSHGGATIATGRATYRLFAVDSEPLPMPEWLMPAFIQEPL